MEDIPQGGAGGVPGHHADEHHGDRNDRGDRDERGDRDDRRTPTVKTVRAGTPVAEQEPEGQQTEDEDPPDPG
ncbi:hypothetical protein ACFQ1I_04230 [Kitasatospora arboriphila]